MDDIPLSPEAQALADATLPAIQEILDRAAKTPVSILVWGPDPDGANSVAAVRKELRRRLRKDGHAAYYSEELYDKTSKHSPRIQQIAQAQKFDLVLSVPDSPGSIGEVHDFAGDRRVSAKMLIFINVDYLEGYSAKSLIALESLRTCTVIKYDGSAGYDQIYEIADREVQSVRETKFILGGVI
ncbi:MAG: hypothetical protein KA250_13560 [Verrucomicrobiales bacterium]|nr:hypothetical protein [Verrucomicrobiales bacterium]